MLEYRAMPDRGDEGLWVVCYRIPGTQDQYSVVGAGYPERRARAMADRLNEDGAAADARALEVAMTKPEDRRLAPGFYSEENP